MYNLYRPIVNESGLREPKGIIIGIWVKIFKYEMMVELRYKVLIIAIIRLLFMTYFLRFVIV